MRVAPAALAMLLMACSALPASKKDAKSDDGKTTATTDGAADTEADKADRPQEVSGAFLYCADDVDPPADVPVGADEGIVACIVKDKAGLRADGQPSDVKIKLKSGQATAPVATEPSKEATWHVYFTIKKGDLDALASITVDFQTKLGETIAPMTDNAKYDWLSDPIFAANLTVAVFYQKYGEKVNNAPPPKKAMPAVPADAKHLLFPTQKQYKGNLGGLAGADKICAEAGATVDPARTWVALLSTSTVAAKSRVTFQGPIYNLNAEKLADDGAGLFGAQKKPLPTYTEIGWNTADYVLPDLGIAFNRAWTGSDWYGDVKLSNGTCNDWTTSSFQPTGAAGSTDADDGRWFLVKDPQPCAHMSRIYCISQ